MIHGFLSAFLLLLLLSSGKSGTPPDSTPHKPDSLPLPVSLPLKKDSLPVVPLDTLLGGPVESTKIVPATAAPESAEKEPPPQNSDTTLQPEVILAPPPAWAVSRNSIRVYLGRVKPAESLNFQGKYQVFSSSTDVGTLQGNTVLKQHKGSFSLGNFISGLKTPVRFIPTEAGALFQFGKRRYRGELIIRISTSGKVIAINELPVEDYLRGVVPYEIGKRDSSAFDALKVQAVMARTYTYTRLNAHNADGFDLFSDVSDQVYFGTQGEYPLSNAAVDATTDQVAVYHDTLIQAFYFSTSNGRTANISEVWPDRPARPYLKSVKDSLFNCTSKSFFWQEEWSGSAANVIVNDALRALFRDFKKGRLEDIVIDENTTCGRIRKMTFTVSGRTYSVFGDKVRWALKRNAPGRPILRSACFSLEVDKNKKGISHIKAIGRGYGHGVGMSQIGAVNMAIAGKPFQEIIKFYYSGTEITKVKY